MAQAYFGEVNSYVLNIGRSESGPGELGRTYERKIRLKINSGRFGGGVVFAELNFLDEYRPGDQRSFRDGNTVKISTYTRDYADVYEMLKSEKPISFIWQELENSRDDFSYINVWRLTTSTEEPLAEGDSEL